MNITYENIILLLTEIDTYIKDLRNDIDYVNDSDSKLIKIYLKKIEYLKY